MHPKGLCSGFPAAGRVLRALLRVSNVCVELLENCASLSGPGRIPIQEGERPSPGDFGLCISSALLKTSTFCVIKLLLSSYGTQSTSLVPLFPHTGTALPWSVLLHLCPLLSCPSWKSTVTPRSR